MNIFIELAIIIGIATGLSLLMRLLRQPLIIAYILTGFVVGPYVFNMIHSQEAIRAFSELGIAFLLFIVGLNLSPRVIKEVGVASFIVGFGQVVITSIVGFFIAQQFGFGIMPSWYIAIALTFSSTIVVLKVLSDKGDLDKLYGKLSIGLLLFQDLVATLLLIFAGSISTDALSVSLLGDVGVLFAKGAVVTGMLVAISVYILPRLNNFLGKSQELLFMFSIGWGLGIAAIFSVLGLSLEVGALIAGVALALSPYHREISARMRPLRDFFVVLFFVFLGSQMSLGNTSTMIYPALIFSAYVLIGNPIIVMVLMGAFGYTKQVSFKAGLTMGQVSEFSLILILMGVKSGQLSQDILSLVTFVALIAMAGSTYIMLYNDALYKVLSPFLKIFERKKVHKDSSEEKIYDIILFGCSRVGYDFVDTFQKEKKNFLVVDFDPKIINRLKNEGVECIYGDAEDLEFLDELHLSESKMVISTMPEHEANMVLVEYVQQKNKDIIVIATAHTIEASEALYNKGASYVIMPHFLGAVYASEMVLKNGFAKDNFAWEKQKQLVYLETKKARGHDHPQRDIRS